MKIWNHLAVQAPLHFLLSLPSSLSWLRLIAFLIFSCHVIIKIAYSKWKIMIQASENQYSIFFSETLELIFILAFLTFALAIISFFKIIYAQFNPFAYLTS